MAMCLQAMFSQRWPHGMQELWIVEVKWFGEVVWRRPAIHLSHTGVAPGPGEEDRVAMYISVSVSCSPWSPHETSETFCTALSCLGKTGEAGQYALLILLE